MRDNYISHVKQLRNHLQGEEGKNYTVFQGKGKDHQFSEVFVADSLEAFDAMEDNQDDVTRRLLQDIENCIEKGTTRYTTMLELE